jgi:hypothetical protein
VIDTVNVYDSGWAEKEDLKVSSESERSRTDGMASYTKTSQVPTSVLDSEGSDAASPC